MRSGPVSEHQIVVLPFVANLDSACAVKLILVVLRVEASVFNADPNVVQAGMTFTMNLCH